MAGVPSIGDILMLSTIAWKIGCAFTSGRTGAPTEFQEIENELNSLTKALTSLAEALDGDDSLLAQADSRTREGYDKIVGSCHQSLDNLTSFVNQYQEIKRTEDGLTVQRSWKRVLIRNWKTILWTSEGGNIEALRSMLQMHTTSISLTIQALQSKSLSRLEKTIGPMANKVDDIHESLGGDIGCKIDEIHMLMMNIAATEGSGKSQWPLRTTSYTPPRETPLAVTPKSRINSLPSEQLVSPTSPTLTKRYDSPAQTPELMGSSVSTYSYPSRNSTAPSCRSAGSRDSLYDHRESGLFPPPEGFSRWGDYLPKYEPTQKRRTSSNHFGSKSSGRSPAGFLIHRLSEASGYEGPESPDLVLPPPIIPINEIQPTEAMSHLNFNTDEITPADPSPAMISGNTTTDAEQSAFEKAVFMDTAILCEVTAKTVEYTQPDEDEPGGLKMVEAAGSSRVFISTNRQKLSNGSVRFSTSIWTLSEDRKARVQQELGENQEIIPYTVWGNTEKVSIRVPTNLTFHDTVIDAKPLHIHSTSWVNYVFHNQHSATLFQNALMGKTLILSVKTNKTLRTWDNKIENTFSFQEQLCGLENLRLWQDQDSGNVLAMLHYSAQFRDGYMAFYVNSMQNPVKIKDDGDKWVRIRGLSIPLAPKGGALPPGGLGASRRPSLATDPGSPPLSAAIKSSSSLLTTTTTTAEKKKKEKKKGHKYISGARIEFTTEMEKEAFLGVMERVRGMLLFQEEGEEWNGKGGKLSAVV
ncbi:MAG: hypothetical protein M1834_006145 [Cirrosporium novae-zelandiae]|nr:MAG: hypothetical protein M1834_006145 [Cirrosporium novae-zelandiae]